MYKRVQGACVGAVLFLALAEVWSADAQSTARQARPEEVARTERGPDSAASQEIPNPMLLEVELGGGGRTGIDQLGVGQTWVNTSTARFTCDRANVQQVEVHRLKSPPHRRLLKISPVISSGWYRQDIDLTMRVLTPDGRELERKQWNDYTIGNEGGPYSGATRRPELELYIKTEEFEGMFAGGKGPRLELLVEIQNEEGDEDDD